MRQTEGLLRSVARLLNLEIGIPDHTTLSRPSVTAALASDLAAVTGPVHVAIDSTGTSMGAATSTPSANCIWRLIRTTVKFWRAC